LEYKAVWEQMCRPITRWGKNSFFLQNLRFKKNQSFSFLFKNALLREKPKLVILRPLLIISAESASLQFGTSILS